MSKSAVVRTIEGYGENATAHGVRYVFPKQPLVDRIIWGVIVFCFTGKFSTHVHVITVLLYIG